jgi:hypothetical protein
MAICSGERIKETLCVPDDAHADSAAPVLVKNSESTHARPKLAAIHAAEEVRPIIRLGGPTNNSDACWLTVVAG